MMTEKKTELDSHDTERLDEIHNKIHALICDLAGKEDLPWNIEPIGEISDIIEQYVCNELGLMTEMEFAPYIEEEL